MALSLISCRLNPYLLPGGPFFLGILPVRLNRFSQVASNATLATGCLFEYVHIGSPGWGQPWTLSKYPFRAPAASDPINV